MDAGLEALLLERAERCSDAALLSLASAYESDDGRPEFNADAATARWERTGEVIEALCEAARIGDGSRALELARYFSEQDAKAARRIANTPDGRRAFAARQIPLVDVVRGADGVRAVSTARYVKPTQTGTSKRANSRRAEMDAARWDAWVVSHMQQHAVSRPSAERAWIDDQLMRKHGALKNCQSPQYKRARRALWEQTRRYRAGLKRATPNPARMA